MPHDFIAAPTPVLKDNNNALNIGTKLIKRINSAPGIRNTHPVAVTTHPRLPEQSQTWLPLRNLVIAELYLFFLFCSGIHRCISFPSCFYALPAPVIVIVH